METAEITNWAVGEKEAEELPAKPSLTLCSSQSPHYQTWSKFLVTKQLQGKLRGQRQRGSVRVGWGGGSVSYWLLQDTAQLKIKDD